ncbi:hypothetical protein MLGJGCBP_01271 [Rhodococcus sp. T7]|nr:hypothetical protein [Rhodococcus opacus]EID80001.1 hypothetical protein W59_10409 [Rhodococcus opacus RKJ300 = JCM 13270]KAF0965573.1 hypothetical protein MLGJGCBP_01271 [Rhodococcus sp. T7]
MLGMREALLDKDVAADNIHYEVFGPDSWAAAPEVAKIIAAVRRKPSTSAPPFVRPWAEQHEIGCPDDDKEVRAAGRRRAYPDRSARLSRAEQNREGQVRTATMTVFAAPVVQDGLGHCSFRLS